MIKKIVSGGQTGADRGGLDAGLAMNIPIGGWAPKNFEAEDGRVPEHYGLKECPIGGYIARTEQNVIDSDATAIFYYGKMNGGTLLTKKACILHEKPYIAIDCLKEEQYNLNRLKPFLEKHSIINVAGPRESKAKKLGRSSHADAKNFLMLALKSFEEG